jgi:hypothetical protein
MPIWVRPIIIAMEEAEFGMNKVGGQSRQIVYVSPSWKYSTENRVGGVTQEFKHLLSKSVALSSNTSTTIIKKIK